MAAIWLTPAGDLGVIPALEYFQFRLDAYNPDGGDLSYSVISGSLPAGLQLDENGNVQGVPVNLLLEGVPAAVNKVTTSKFVIRVTTQSGQVTDRQFTLSVAGIVPPQIIPKNVELGQFFDGELVSLNLYAVEMNPDLTVTWDFVTGELPPGVTLNSNGLLQGYIQPVNAPGLEPGWETQSWENSAWDFRGEDVSRNYRFTVTAFDGVNYDSSTYTIYVYARENMTADYDVITVDNNTIITSDDDNVHVPVILTLDTTLPTVRQNERHAFQIEAEDFDGDALEWEILDGESELNSVGLYLNNTTGWITGFIPSGALADRSIEFEIVVKKRDYPTYVSIPFTYTVNILGQVDSTVTWVTASNLGIIDNGKICDFHITATTPSNRALFYRIPTGSDSKLPQGLQLLIDGNISGRVAFETFKIDGSETTFDGTYTTFDKVYNFTVETYDVDGFISDTKTFSITVNEANRVPYNNLYIQALPSKVQRDTYNSIINDSDIFPIEDLYRVNDPWFGKNLLIRSLFLTGINPDSTADYISAMENNHYWKKINFGQLKTAQALDSNFDVKYEVVYLELNDNQVNENGASVSSNVALVSNTRNVSTIHPNSFITMVEQFTNNIGYANKSILPDWMTSRQENGRVLGFTRALVLCYTKPGKSNKIAYRLQSKLARFQEIDFTIDRYELDSIMTNYYNLDNNSFVNYFSGTGNITVANSSPTVSGVSTIFARELSIGQTLVINNTEIGRIQEITSNTSLILFANSTITANSASFSHTIGETTFDRSTDATTFDHNQTRFYTGRVPYTTPSQGDKYLKFPQIGVLE